MLIVIGSLTHTRAKHVQKKINQVAAEFLFGQPGASAQETVSSDDDDESEELVIRNTSMQLVALRARISERKRTLGDVYASARDDRTIADKLYDAILPLLHPVHKPSSIGFHAETGTICVTDMVRMCTRRSVTDVNRAIKTIIVGDPRRDEVVNRRKHAFFCSRRLAAEICAGALRANRAKTELLRAMGIHATVLFPIAEVDTVTSLSTTFAAYDPIRQYQVVGCHNNLYRIDLYLRKAKIAIECDERGHSSYSKTREDERQRTIEAQLGCHFVRYDPGVEGCYERRRYDRSTTEKATPP